MKIRFIDNEKMIKMLENVCEDFKESKLFEITYGEYPMRNSNNRRLYVETPDAMQFFERLYRKLYAKFDDYVVAATCTNDPYKCVGLCEYKEQCINDFRHDKETRKKEASNE